VLYVALTRAIHAMHLIVAPSRDNEAGLPTTFAGILRAALTSGGRLESGASAYDHGDAAWHSAPSADRSHHAPRDESGVTIPDVISPSAHVTRSVTATLVASSPPHAVRGLGRESPSSLEGGRHVDLRNRLRLGNAPALERGSLFHAWFELIEWLDDGEPADAALREAAQCAGVRSDNLDEMIAEFRRMLAEPEIRSVLSRPAATRGRTFEVWRERPFVIRWDDSLLAGKFDRVVLTREGSRAVRAEVLDFKTDAIPTDEPGRLDELVKHYRPQLDAYRAAAARLTGLKPSQVGARLLFVTIGAVKEL
jgi:ATP-dependent exoDNAse (exonuclease V) beta subunit